jgi:hypothetical protein
MHIRYRTNGAQTVLVIDFETKRYCDWDFAASRDYFARSFLRCRGGASNRQLTTDLNEETAPDISRQILVATVWLQIL